MCVCVCVCVCVHAYNSLSGIHMTYLSILILGGGDLTYYARLNIKKIISF